MTALAVGCRVRINPPALSNAYAGRTGEVTQHLRPDRWLVKVDPCWPHAGRLVAIMAAYLEVVEDDDVPRRELV